MNKMFPVIGVLAILLGLTFLGGTVILALRKYLRLKKSIAATGVVIHVETGEGMRQSQFDRASPRNTLYKPTVRFQTADGRVIDYTPMMASSWSNYRIGENISVQYDPRQPEKAMIGNASFFWLPFVICGFFGGLSTLVGTFFVMLF